MRINLEQLRHQFHTKRFAERLTLEEVAEETKVSAATLYRFERNKSVPQLEQFFAILDWLGYGFELVEKGQGQPSEKGV